MFEVVVNETVRVKNSYFILATDMSEALSLLVNEQPKVVTSSGRYSNERITEPLENTEVVGRTVEDVRFTHQAYHRNKQYQQNVRTDLISRLKKKLDVRVETYQPQYNVQGLVVGSHRFVVYSEMSDDKRCLNTYISRKHATTHSRFMDENSRMRPLTPEEVADYSVLGSRSLVTPNYLKQVAPDLVQSVEIFSAEDYEMFLNKLADMIKAAKPCVGSLDRNSQGQSRVCNSCPYQLSCIGTKV